jgi:hypothetical protein
MKILGKMLLAILLIPTLACLFLATVYLGLLFALYAILITVAYPYITVFVAVALILLLSKLIKGRKEHD